MAERLRDFLHEYDIPFRLEFGEQPLKVVDDPLAPLVGIGRISAGLSLPDAGSAAVRRNRRLRRSRARPAGTSPPSEAFGIHFRPAGSEARGLRRARGSRHRYLQRHHARP